MTSPPPQDPPDRSGDALTADDWTEGVEVERGPSISAQVSNAMVGLKKRFYGRGPTKCKTYICDSYVFAVLEEGLLPHEEVLLAADQEEEVRQYRLRFQRAMREPTTDAVAQITGRTVLTYHSQIVFDPVRTFEIFVLDQPLT